MRILDIDLDFFLSDVMYGFLRKMSPRTSGKICKPWDEIQVRKFLEKRCLLNTTTKIPGKCLIEHSEVFTDWRDLILLGRLVPPFEVVHVDAHADLGLGDCAYMYIATELLALPLDQRMYPKSDKWYGLLSSNYLLFALACRWIDKLTYVRNPNSRPDIPEHIMQGHDLASPFIQLKYYGKSVGADLITSRKTQPLSLEPKVRFDIIDGDIFQSDIHFDIMYLTKSPKYTPKMADKLIPIISEYFYVE